MSAPQSAEKIRLHLESILDRCDELKQTQMEIVGLSSVSAFSFFLSQSIHSRLNNLPHLVVVSSLKEAHSIAENISAFSTGDRKINCHIFPHFDVSPYVGLYPKSAVSHQRMEFLIRAQNARPGDIFLAPIQGLLQKTLPFEVLAEARLKLRKNDDLPEKLNSLLQSWGYLSVPMVEDIGHFSNRGGIVDIYCAHMKHPIRFELFGDTIESIRLFDPNTQRSLGELDVVEIFPASEIVMTEDSAEKALLGFQKYIESREIKPAHADLKEEISEIFRSLSRETRFSGIEFLLPYFYDKLASPLEHFNQPVNLWYWDSADITRAADEFTAEMKADFSNASLQALRTPVKELFLNFEGYKWDIAARTIAINPIDTNLTAEKNIEQKIAYPTFPTQEIATNLSNKTAGQEAWNNYVSTKISKWKEEGYQLFIIVRNETQCERLKMMLQNLDFKTQVSYIQNAPWEELSSLQKRDRKLLHLVIGGISDSFRLPEDHLILLRDEDLLGKKTRARNTSSVQEFQEEARRLSFGDLKPGDKVVHIQHGIGIYDGLKIMNINGAETEFIQLSYKDSDKLYLPVYRVNQLQKYSGMAVQPSLDKLGGGAWEKTKLKVKSHLRDIASDLLKLYAERAELSRPSYKFEDDSFHSFEAAFPFDETDDQNRAINEIVKDLRGPKPMDRLICGDVGFGKTEVAMRAAFMAAVSGRQVAVLAPTTVLVFQHLETFKKRFQGWPLQIRALNRFVSNADAKKILNELKEGRVDIIIGTHRLLSKDVEYKNLGLLIVDEEQKFGVTHKEKIRKLKNSVDTLAMSATPIPRTLNMSLVGIRDLSLINTAPVDRLPTRTFICKFDAETIRKAIESEISRGGQVYFIHNRIQSIYSLADELRQIVPNVRLRVAHGQMPEDELEKTMVDFFHHQIDVLVCTAIVESGMDIPKANTMFIDRADIFGLSQLYQLRGRVGRSTQRAYCYLLLPKDKKIDATAQERLKVIQENTALGSGIRIAQYDLELRGAGNILGEEQSGHVDSVGYELYMDLLQQTLSELKGDPQDNNTIDPEINLRVPALIPDKYIGDIRMRLAYYKALSEIRAPEDLDRIESDLQDQFGDIPEPTKNLMGLMLIRLSCRQLGVRDLSAGLKNISLIFTEKTPIRPETFIKLAMRENKKYAITPDNRLNIRMNVISWPAVYEELNQLLKLVQ